MAESSQPSRKTASLSSVELGSGPRLNSSPGVQLRLDTGLGRNLNEDWCAWQRQGARSAFVVCDGMGGMKHGEKASRRAGSSFLNLLMNRESGTWPPGGWPDPEMLALQLNVELLTLQQELHEPRIATTLTAIIIQKRAAMLVHVGDSRAYLFRESRIIQLSRDHTLVSSMQLSEDESLNHPHKHIVTRGLGMSGPLQLDHRKFRPEQGDRLLLCSDGLWNAGMLRRDLLRLAIRHRDSMDFADALIREALDKGAPDNLGLLVVDLERFL